MSEAARLGLVDRLIVAFDKGLRTTCGVVPHGARPSPAEQVREGLRTRAERRRTGRLLRVDHAGEVAAQALYEGQALTARRAPVRRSLENAAREEIDHLAWCRQRLVELDSRPSRLDPVWYAGSYAIGAIAGAAGDRWSLGFVAETEQQVVAHLERHLRRLAASDARSRALLGQMAADERRHATTALHAGARALPAPVKAIMRLASKVMTGTAYWI